MNDEKDIRSIVCQISQDITHKDLSREIMFELLPNNEVRIESYADSLFDYYNMRICAWDLPYMIRALQRLHDTYVDEDLTSKED